MKVTNPGERAPDTHNLNEFFALLYKIDLRNKRQEKASSEESNKNKEPQIKNGDGKNVE